MTKATTKRSEGMQIRQTDSGPFTLADLENKFSKGLYVFGTRSQLFTLSVSLLCIDVLSQDVSKTPLELHERVEGGSIVVQPDAHPVAALLNEPSDYYGPREFLRILTAHLVTASEHFVAVKRSTKRIDGGAAVEMQGIPRRKTEVRVDPDSRTYSYWFSPSTLHDRAQFGWAQGGMLARDVAHLRKRTMDGIDALATSQLMRNTLNLLEEMQTYQAGIFENGGMPIMAFSFPDGMTDEQFDRLKADFKRMATKARKDGTPFILEGHDGELPKVDKVSLSSIDTEFTKAQAAAGLEATRYFRVPPHKVSLLETLKYDNLAAEERRYVSEALDPIFDVIEEGLGRLLLSKEDRRRYFPRFDREKAYTADPAERQKITESRWKNGMTTFDEMRRDIGKNVKGGDAGKRRMFSGNFVIVDEDDEVVLRAGGNAPGDNEKMPAEEPKKGIRLVQSN